MYKSFADCLENYADLVIQSGIIRSPGKFENEPLATLWFYDAMICGDGEIIQVNNNGVTEIVELKLTEVEKEFFKYNFCQGTTHVRLTLDNNGSVHLTALTNEQNQ